MSLTSKLKNTWKYLGLGIATTYNENEKTLIKQTRNMTPNIWINRFFNPGQLYKTEKPNNYEKKGTLLVPKEQIIKTDNTIYNQMRKQLEEKTQKIKDY